MSDVRCPMCGKSNPPDLEVCQFCEARLKPLIGSPAEEESFTDFQRSEPVDEHLIPDGPADSGTNLTDWLKSLRVDDEESPPSSPAEEDSQTWLPVEDIGSQLEDDAHEGQGDRDWLSNLRQEGDVTDEAYKEQDEFGEGLFDPDSSTEDLPSWLSAKDDQSVDEGAIDIPESQALLGLEQPEIEEDETPEWLRKVRARQEAEDTESQPAESSIEDESEDVPFWMEESKESSSEEATQASSTAERLSDLTVQTTEADSGTIGEVIESETDDVIEGGEEQVEATSSQPFTEEDVPDWLSDFDVEGVDQAIEKDLNSEEVPEWLSKLEEAAGLEQQPLEPASEELPSMDIGSIDEGDPGTPTLIFDDEELAPEVDDEGLATKVDEEALKTEVEIQSVAPFTLDGDDEGLYEEDLTDLLAEIPDQDVAEAVDESLVDDDLAPAELPGWLEAMRPVESAAPLVPTQEESNQQVEGGGPLAGLRGVLPAEPEIARLKKPTVYTSKLQISENHRLHATILNDLIKGEKRTQPLPTSPVLSSQQILRWSIFGLLSLAVLWFVFTGSQSVPLPVLSSSILDVSNIINELPENSPVLLAVDYEPGISGEMDAASAGVMDHLMIKGSYLTMASTAVTGPAQAERLLKNVNASMGHQYQGPDQYTNLGYIPGGPTGLAGFADAPRQVLPYSLDGDLAWDRGALTGIESLADFMLVLVITESPDTARTWVEQVQPTLDGTPLVMVISAQAEPMVRPYYEGFPQQVQGIVAGLAGGAAYESGLPRTSLARSYWDAYSFIVWLAVLLILVGGAINLTASQLTSRKGAKREVSS
jgi:hypothetical protein